MARLHHAFTLIELLIVVAIIAILAAIAVPNFLEAQTRSKVSRVRSDMRTMASAMESYAVDNNKYPIPSDMDGFKVFDVPGARLVSPFETRVPVLLTTPVAYMASRPEDIFAVHRELESRLYNTVTEDYLEIRANYAPVANWRLEYLKFFRQLTGAPQPQQVAYFFGSWGPDMDHDVDAPHAGPTRGPHVHGEACLYDPTNGTISSGDLFYFGPGLGFMTQ